MPVTIDIAEEGDAFDATKLNSQFTPLQTAVNALEGEDVSRGALQRVHLPSPIHSVFLTGSPRGGLSAICPDDPAEEVYRSGVPLSGGPPYLATWQSFNANPTTGSGGAAAPYGPVASGNGWRIPAYDGDIAYAAERRLADASASPGVQGWGVDNAFGVSALFLEFELNLCGSDAYTIGESPVAENRDSHIWVAVGYELDTGTRGIIESSIRWFPIEGHVRGNVGTFGLLKAEDLPEGTGVVAVFGAVLTQRATGSTALGTPIRFDYYHFNYEPIKGTEA